MDEYENEALPVGEAQVAEAMQTLQCYKAGKAALTSALWITNCGSAWGTGKITRTP